MKKHRKLNLRKLSVAKSDTHSVRQGIKGGTDDDLATNNLNCKTDEINCGTSAKTIPEFTSDPNDPNFTWIVGPCV